MIVNQVTGHTSTHDHIAIQTHLYSYYNSYSFIVHTIPRPSLRHAMTWGKRFSILGNVLTSHHSCNWQRLMGAVYISPVLVKDHMTLYHNTLYCCDSTNMYIICHAKVNNEVWLSSINFVCTIIYLLHMLLTHSGRLGGQFEHGFPSLYGLSPATLPLYSVSTCVHTCPW